MFSCTDKDGTRPCIVCVCVCVCVRACVHACVCVAMVSFRSFHSSLHV